MDPIIVWILFLLVNGQGGVAEGYSTEEECKESRAEVIQVPTTLYAAECTRMILLPVHPQVPKGIGEKQ